MTFTDQYKREPQTQQEHTLDTALQAGWRVVVWDGEKICLVHAGSSRHSAKKYAEIDETGNLTTIRPLTKRIS